jgi:hypothetical protein
LQGTPAPEPITTCKGADVSEVSPTEQAAAPAAASREIGPQGAGPEEIQETRAPEAGSEVAGADRFAAQRAALDTLADRPLSEHADTFGQVHAQLQAALAEIDGI